MSALHVGYAQIHLQSIEVFQLLITAYGGKLTPKYNHLAERRKLDRNKEY